MSNNNSEKAVMPNTLEELLNVMGSNKPLRNTPKKVSGEDCIGWDYLTQSGWKAYGKLTNLLYGVGKVCGINVDEIIDKLDEIADTEIY